MKPSLFYSRSPAAISWVTQFWFRNAYKTYLEDIFVYTYYRKSTITTMLICVKKKLETDNHRFPTYKVGNRLSN